MKLSVVIPVRNEESSVRALLDALLNQTLRPAEIVIADAGSTDATTAIISEYVSRGEPVRLICGGPGLPGSARNQAAAHARNEWLAFIDAGTEPESNWLESLAQKAEPEDEIDVVYGSFEPVTDTLFKLCSVMAYVAPPFEMEGRLIRARSIVSALMKRSVWEAVGGFPEDLRSAEDLLFMNKIEQANFRVARAPDAMVHWEVQPTIGGMFKRFVEYSRNNLRAGLWHDWQGPLFRRYALLLVAALPAIVLGSWWLLISLLLWFLFLNARAMVTIWRNRLCYPAGVGQKLARMLWLVPILAALDSATIIGTIKWVFIDNRHISENAEKERHDS